MGNCFTNTSQYEIHDYNNTYNYDHNYPYDSSEHEEFIIHVATCIIIAISLPLILVAIYSLYSLVRKDNVAPIYVINLLISDLIQLCCLIIREAIGYRERTDEEWLIYEIFHYIHLYGVVVSVCFMVCIALERYLVIACPLWYRCRRTIKSSVVVCVLVWVVPLVPLLTFHLWAVSIVHFYIVVILLLLPFPLFIFFLGGTLKALSASISVSSEEKRRIVGILVLVLLIYTLLFLPFIIVLCSLLSIISDIQTILFNVTVADIDRLTGLFGSLPNLSLMLLRLSPLADLVLYIVMRKGAVDKLLASLCCCRMDSNDVISPDNNDVSSTLV